VFALSAGFIVAFCALALADLESLSAIINASFGWSVKYFGFYWQILLLATFVIGIVLAITPAGSVVLGNKKEPEFGWFQW
jgi:choline-glycine betaine transporter